MKHWPQFWHQMVQTKTHVWHCLTYLHDIHSVPEKWMVTFEAPGNVALHVAPKLQKHLKGQPADAIKALLHVGFLNGIPR